MNLNVMKCKLVFNAGYQHMSNIQVKSSEKVKGNGHRNHFEPSHVGHQKLDWREEDSPSASLSQYFNNLIFYVPTLGVVLKLI